MNKIKFIFLIIYSFSKTHGQSSCSSNPIITIEQVMLEGSSSSIRYEISKKHLKVKITKEIFNYTVTFKRQVYSMRLKRDQLDSLRLIVNKMDLYSGQDNYSSNELDGINWTFIIKQDSLVSSMSLNNYYLPQYGVILDFINRQLPAKRRYISFDYFDTRKKFENK